MSTRLRFPDEPTARAALAQYVGADGWIVASHAHALDPIGVLYEPGEYDAEGNVIVEPAPLAGWHVNLVGEVPEAALPYVVAPGEPMRVWAGEG